MSARQTDQQVIDSVVRAFVQAVSEGKLRTAEAWASIAFGFAALAAEEAGALDERRDA